VVFVADHFLRPILIGGAARLPFLWVLLGIFGGLETFGLLGLFLGPTILATLLALWREWARPDAAEMPHQRDRPRRPMRAAAGARREHSMKFGPLMATSVGSLPRPIWLAATDRSRATFRLEGEALREAQDDATILALREQEEIGLDILTDGEQRRESFVYHAAATWDGVDMVHQREKEMYRNRKSPRVVPRITGKVKRRGPRASRRCVSPRPIRSAP